jgi:tetratricopeptide (TPR) repeat protein
MADTAKPVIFISYGHLDEPDRFLEPRATRWLSYVTSHLGPAAAHGKLERWDDRQIDGGGDWRADIDDALNRCAVCVFLVSRHSLSSRFILDVEMKRMLERHHAGGAHLYPIVITSVDLKAAPWLLKLNLKPTNGTALELYEEGPRNKIMSELAAEIREIIERTAAQKANDPNRDNDTKQTGPAVNDYDRLPETPYEELVGRADELKLLDDAWANEKINIVSLIAEGGVGKSALVNRWLVKLQEDKYRGADAVLGWSFFSQGSAQQATSADAFLNWALATLKVEVDTTSATVKAEKLAKAIAARRVLLVLDGVEPLQHGPGPQRGQLKDQGLRAFLRRFAAMSFPEGHSLVVLTSRLAVADIAKWKDGSAPVKDLGQLSPEAGAALLKGNAVEGPLAELQQASREVGGHALTLTLLAGFLRELHHGDVRRRGNVRGFFADPHIPGAEHAAKVMQSYKTDWLMGQPLLHAIMHMVGLFDRPASKGCLDELRRKPPIAGLTDAVVGIQDADWQHAVARLRDVKLLSQRDKVAPDDLDAHPLVREWFGERLKKTNETAWKAAHSRLYDYLRRSTKEGDRPTLEQLAPLYQAIVHGCRAGRYQEAFDKIYADRICRRGPDGEIEFYAHRKLGATGSDLAAISWFFDAPYATPVATLNEAARSWVLSMAAFCLRGQGRLAEALPAMRVALRMHEDAEDWSNAAIGSSNLSEAELLVGDVASAVATAERSVAHADRSGDRFQMIVKRGTHAGALHAAGRRDAAEALFAEAERRQRERQPNYPLLYSFQGYQYCDLLLAKGAYVSVLERTKKIIEWEAASHSPSLLDRGSLRLSLGRAHFGLALNRVEQQQPSATRETARIARARLAEAVDGLRAAGQSDFIPLGLLARAAFRRSVGDWEGAARDLDEVEEITEPGPMRLYLCDMALERARLALAQSEAFAPLNGMLETDNPAKPEVPSEAKIAELRKEAAEQIRIAADYIKECGYHRRDEELAELQDVLAGARSFAGLPPRV